ncbi:MAG: DUF1552 domain-containing protein [Myxococcota bacterium]
MPILSRWSLSRRHVLSGMAAGGMVSLALPPLEAMFNAHATAYAGGEALPKRFVTWLWGNGVDLHAFEPEATGPGYVLPEMLELLEPVKDYVSVLTGLSNLSANFTTHHPGMVALSGHNYIPRPDLPGVASDWGGPTIDQVIADVIADQVELPVRSMQVGLSRHLSPVDYGTVAQAISARGTPGDLTPLPPEFQPVAAWENIFGEFVPQPDDRFLRSSALDVVKDSTDRLRTKLGTADNLRLDAHLQGVFELEAKIAALPPQCTLPEPATFVNDYGLGAEPLTEITQIMSELVAMAFHCDVTRVASMQALHIAAEVPLTEVGQADTHHNLSHQNDDSYRDGIRYLLGQLSTFMQTLLATEDLAGLPLLDSTIVYATTEVAVGYTHQVNRQPLILGGHGRGHLVHPGIHHQAIAAEEPHGSMAPSAGNISDVLLSLAQGFDPTATEIGSEEPFSDTPLDAILA